MKNLLSWYDKLIISTCCVASKQMFIKSYSAFLLVKTLFWHMGLELLKISWKSHIKWMLANLLRVWAATLWVRHLQTPDTSLSTVNLHLATIMTVGHRYGGLLASLGHEAAVVEPVCIVTPTLNCPLSGVIDCFWYMLNIWNIILSLIFGCSYKASVSCLYYRARF